MEAIILSKDALEEMQKDIKVIKKHVISITSPAEQFVDNKAFIKLMGISHRTAQNWRDDGKIGFTKEGQKVYYRMSDIIDFMERYHRKPLTDLKSSLSI